MIRNRQNPRKRVTAFISKDVMDGLEAEMKSEGLSLGQLIDRMWLRTPEGAVRAATRDLRAMNSTPTPDLPHIFDFTVGGGLKVCRFCRNAPTSEIGRRKACPDRRE
jgi:hypothetical protein